MHTASHEMLTGHTLYLYKKERFILFAPLFAGSFWRFYHFLPSLFANINLSTQKNIAPPIKLATTALTQSEALPKRLVPLTIPITGASIRLDNCHLKR